MSSETKSASSLEERIIAMEKRALEGRVLAIGTPGTQLIRALVDVDILDREGVPLPEAARFHEDSPLSRRESILVWSLGIGGLRQPKLFFHGYTIEEAVARAEEGVEEAIGAWQQAVRMLRPLRRRRVDKDGY